MTSLVGHCQLIVRISLFGDVDFEIQRLAVGFHHARAVVIDDVLGIDQRAAIADQPVDAVIRSAFLIRRQREDEVAIEMRILLLQANHRRHHDRIAGLHVLGAATVEISILLDELERIGRPVLPTGFHDVEVPDEQ